jgi:hypothetical protein
MQKTLNAGGWTPARSTTANVYGTSSGAVFQKMPPGYCGKLSLNTA